MGRGKTAINKRRGHAKRNIIIIIIAAAFVFAGIFFRYLLFPALNVVKSLEMEAGEDAPAVAEFLKKEDSRAALVTDMDSLTLSVPGTYEVEIQIGRGVYESSLVVVDTIAPKGETQDIESVTGLEIEPEEFVTEYSDVTAVTVSYKEPPDFTLEGEQEVVIVLTDEGGNETELTAVLTLIVDDEAPVIEGVEDQTIYEGDSISYKSGVTVTDNWDEEVELEIDNSEVDLNTAGVYTVTYSATDTSGNTTVVTAQITVEEIPEGIENIDEMNELAQEALEECLTDDMDEEEQLYAIFWYVKNHMSYTGSSDKSSYINEAINGFNYGYGDCFTYFSMMKAMMENAGFETIDVQRINGETDHYWSLVNLDGDWYHIDACPRSEAKNPSWYCFLRTDAELEWFSENYFGYYTFDTSLYPATPDEPYES